MSIQKHFICIDKKLLSQIGTEKAMRDTRWESCEIRPYCSIKCLIAYSDGEIITGKYVHNSDFDKGGFFTSMKEFDLDNTGNPEYWMPLPKLPRKKRSEAA